MADRPGIRHLAETDSTNSACQRLALAGERGPLWVITDRQRKGRGRLGREWQDGAGNFMASGLFHLGLPIGQLAQAGFVSALAVAETLEHFAPGADFRLKWPNDVLLDGAKICGILPETGQGPNGVWLILGVGINLAHAPVIADRSICALRECLHPGASLPSARQVLDVLASRMQDWLAILQEQGFVPVRSAWLDRAHGLGRSISISGLGEGVFEDIDETGALCMRRADQSVKQIHAGEIFFT